jgi:hypothetical protein
MRRYIALSVLVACLTATVTSVAAVNTTTARGAASKGATAPGLDFRISEVAGKFVPISPGHVDWADVRCPAGRTATGSGFGIKGSAGVEAPFVTTNVLVGDAAEVEIDNPSLGHTVEAHAVVYCATPNP